MKVTVVKIVLHNRLRNVLLHANPRVPLEARMQSKPS